MGRKFIVERGIKALPNNQQSKHNQKSVPDEATIIFIQAKGAKGIRKSTINGYLDTVRYFKNWLKEDISYIDEITPSIIRNYINYLRNERQPYLGDKQRERQSKGLSVNTINIRLRNLKTIL